MGRPKKKTGQGRPGPRQKLMRSIAPPAQCITQEVVEYTLPQNSPILMASEASQTATTTVSGPGFSGDDLSSVASASSSMNVEPSVAVAGPSSRVVDHEIDAPHTALTTEEEETESDFDAPKTPHEVLESFVDNWLDALDREDTRCLSLFLCYHFVKMFSFTETNAAEYAALMVKRSDRTVRRWRSAVIENDGILPESQQGCYQRSGVLWKNEELSKKATEYVRENAAVKGRLNLTTIDFCRWVNDCLLPNSTLEPGFPWKIGVETARLWLHHLGFEVLTVRKGIFIDGHERSDVVDARKLFLRKLTKLGFLHFTNAPNEDAMRALPDVDCPTSDQRAKTFHDESTFMS